MAFIRNVDKLIEGLENKFFTEQRAKDALAPELAAEEAARKEREETMHQLKVLGMAGLVVVLLVVGMIVTFSLSMK